MYLQMHDFVVNNMYVHVFMLVSEGQPLTRYAEKGSSETPVLHSCLTHHSFCGMVNTGKVYKVCQHLSFN